MNIKYTYDLAFSFLYQDEELALNLYNLLKNSLNCFIYSEEQKKIAGTNGEETFNKVFSKEARIVVILYRNEWGKSNWTRIEETAIKNRGFEEGYEFVLLIPVDEKSGAPIWLPKNRLWIGIERWGIKSAASVIEARLQESGVEPRIITLSDQIAEEESKRKKKMEIDNFLNSLEGKKSENKEAHILFELFKKSVNEIKAKTKDWHLHINEVDQKGIEIFSHGYQLTIQYNQYSLEPYLFIAFREGYSGNSNSNEIDFGRYKFDINSFNQHGWSTKEEREKFKTTQQLEEYWLNKLVQKAIKKPKQ